LRSQIAEGDRVTGQVTCRRPYGVFIDIGFGPDAAGLLLVPEFSNAHRRSYSFDEYPQVGDDVTALIRHISWDDRKIALTQNQTYDANSGAWTRPDRSLR
jgi:ribosomal protein S1